MIPRKKLDIGWLDLLAGAAYAGLPGNREALERKIEAAWAPGGRALVALSVRSGLDHLLTTLRLPAGSEVLVSAVTIRDVIRILEAHGLVPVPVDLDMETLSVRPDGLERMLTERTRVLLVAHLFGSRMPIEPLARFACDAGILLVEDCAQAYTGSEWRGHPEADVSMFSFGPIKTGTALGGALLRFRDPDLARRVRRTQNGLPIQARGEFFLRTLKYMGVKALLLPLVFTLFARLCRLRGRSHDAVISGAVRGFAGTGFFAAIRRRASFPLLALLARRLRTFDPAGIRSRIAAAERGLAALDGPDRPGRAAPEHSHWVVPLLFEDPERVAQHLWREGVDATRGASSLHVVAPPSDRPGADPAEARATMDRVLYLPLHPGVSERDLLRLSTALAPRRRS